MNNVLDVRDWEQEAEIRRLRRENRYKMWYAGRKIANWTLITAGAVAIYNAVTTKPEEDEV
jgi:hypothetical protein